VHLSQTILPIKALWLANPATLLRALCHRPTPCDNGLSRKQPLVAAFCETKATRNTRLGTKQVIHAGWQKGRFFPSNAAKSLSSPSGGNESSE
jgi:hypothetical protein